MTGELVLTKAGVLEHRNQLPVLIVRAGNNVEKRFTEFFAAQTLNRHTRETYVRAIPIDTITALHDRAVKKLLWMKWSALAFSRVFRPIQD